MTVLILRVIFVTLWLLPWAPCANAQPVDLAALRSFAGFQEDQWKALDRGNVQTRLLDTRHSREVAVVGAVRLRGTSACFVAQFQEIEKFKKSPSVLKLQKLVPPVTPKHLDDFRLNERDLADLPACRAGKCLVKLPARAMPRLESEVEWGRPEHATSAQSIFKEELAAYINAYAQQGHAALIEYHDKSDPVPLAREFLGVLDARPGVADLDPGFREYLFQYPKDPPRGTSDFFYWSVESFGVKPVASVTHIVIYAQPWGAVIASKQIYASHYFDASLGVTVALDAAGDSPPGMYLVYLNRSRIDVLRGPFGGWRRAILRGRLREGMQKHLTEVGRKVESACGRTP